MAARISERRSPEEDRDRQGLIRGLGQVIVKSSSLLDLPMHAGGSGVIDLQAVNSQVVTSIAGVLGVDQGQGNERTAVFFPRGQDRQAGEVRGLLVAFQRRSPLNSASSKLEGFPGEVAVAPKAPQPGWQQGLSQSGHLSDQLLGTPAKGQLDALRRAEQIGDHRKAASPDALEQQGGTALPNHSPMDLGGFQIGIHFDLDGRKLVLPPKKLQKLSEISQGVPSCHGFPREGQVESDSRYHSHRSRHHSALC